MSLFLPAFPDGARALGRCFFQKSTYKDGLWSAFPQFANFSPKLLAPQMGHLPSLTHVEDRPTKAEWDHLIHEAKNWEKVVLARRSHYRAESSIQPEVLAYKLQALYPEMTPFLVQFSESEAFVGITPERLYRREGNQLYIDALAATCAIRESFNEKHVREFSFVKTSIHAALSPYISSLEWSPNQEKKAGRIKHLHSLGTATLNQEISDEHIINVLHPTAAMGGIPREKTLSFLHEKEPFERGWFASPIGYSLPERAEFFVAIRSAFVKEKDLYLFAGAGIVEGSDSDEEWEELNRKMETVLRVFNH